MEGPLGPVCGPLGPVCGEQIEGAANVHYASNGTTWFVAFAEMTLGESSIGEEYAFETKYELHRDAQGNWFMRPTSARDRWNEEDRDFLADQRDRADTYKRMRNEADIRDEALDAAEADFAGTAVHEWTLCWPNLIPWLESSYQRCLRFFQEHPGLYPQMGHIVYRDKQYDPAKVWAPPSRVTTQDFEASRARLEEAWERLEGEYERLDVPPHLRWERDHGMTTGR